MVDDSPKVWPLGCRKPSNCEQKRACVYTCSAHSARDQIDVANEIDAAVAGVIAGPLNPIKCGGIREATAVEWDALMSEIDAKKAARAAKMPTETDALNQMQEAWTRLMEKEREMFDKQARKMTNEELVREIATCEQRAALLRRELYSRHSDDAHGPSKASATPKPAREGES